MSSRVLIIDGKEPNAGVGGVSAADFSHFSNRFLTAGVLGDTDYLVEAQDTPDMSVKYAAGGAYVEDTTGTFNIPVEDNTGGNVTIEPNVSGNDRIDTIVIAIDTTATPNEDADNIIEVRALEGTPAASPSALTDNEIQTALGAGYAWLKLAEVTVENGAVSITGADVSDMREEVGFTLASASAGTDGWTEAGETWTYASPTTFTVSGDVTAKYQKGTRIKLTQTTAKYFVVTGSSFSTDTTVTITGGTDYTLANAAISDNYYSYQASPQGYPGWFNYTAPSFSGIDNGSGGQPTVSIFRLSIDKKKVKIHCDGSGTKVASDNLFYFTLPIAVANTSNRAAMGSCTYFSGSSNYPGSVMYLTGRAYFLFNAAITDNTVIGGFGCIIEYEF